MAGTGQDDEDLWVRGCERGGQDVYGSGCGGSGGLWYDHVVCLTYLDELILELLVVPMSEYEIERLRRIEENKELMKQLGF